MITLGSWEPDSFIVNDGKTLSVENLLPTANGWGPCPSVEEISSALGAQCVGAVSVRTSANSYAIIAGTTTHLYKFDAAGGGWTDVSGAYTFNVPDGDLWSFALYGDVLLATNFTDGLYELDLVSGTTFAPTAGSPYKAKFVDIAGDFVVLGCLDIGQNMIGWSALNDRTIWTPGTQFSDTQLFPDGGVVRGLACQEAGLVFQEDTVRRMTLVGGSEIFTFSVLARNRRLRACYSVVPIGPVVYAVMDTGICAYTQSGETPLGVGRVDKWLHEYADQSWWPRMIGCADPTATRIYWAFRSVDNSSNLWHDCILSYDINLQRFSLIRQDVDYIFPCASAGLTLENLDAYGDMDSLMSSLDSSVWGGGTPNFAQMSATQILGFRASAGMAGQIVASDRSLTGGRRSVTQAIYPYTDCDSVTAAIAAKATPSEAASYSADIARQASGRIPIRKDGRFHSVRLSFPAGVDWSYVNGFDVDYATSGAR